MRPDDELEIKGAFAELHRRRGEQAPPFRSMRDEAIRRAGERSRVAPRTTQWHRWALAGATVLVAAVATWGFRPVEEHSWAQAAQINKADRVGELIAAIERHVDFTAPPTFSDYPTDLLLAANPEDNLP